MARKKISPPPPPERDDDDDDLVLEPQPRAPDVDEDASSELAGILAELGGASDASISVNKVTLQGEERLGKFMPREFDVDSLRDRYGGGVYWIYFHMGGRLHTKRRVVFARTLEERGGDPGAPRSSSPTSGGDAMLQALDRMAQQQRELLNTVVTVLTSNRAPAIDPMMIISAAEKLANLGNRSSSGSDDLERLMRLAQFARKFGGGEGGDGSGSGLAGFGMELVRLLREQAPAQQLPAPIASGQPAAGDAQQMMILVRRALAERLPMLIRGAQSETDPGVYAQLVLDQVPQPFIAPLIEQLQKPEWFNVLVQIDGRVVPHQAWFEALRNEILQATSQDSPPES